MLRIWTPNLSRGHFEFLQCLELVGIPPCVVQEAARARRDFSMAEEPEVKLGKLGKRNCRLAGSLLTGFAMELSTVLEISVLRFSVFEDSVLEDFLLEDSVLEVSVLNDSVFEDSIFKDSVSEDSVLNDSVLKVPFPFQKTPFQKSSSS